MCGQAIRLAWLLSRLFALEFVVYAASLVVCCLEPALLIRTAVACATSPVTCGLVLALWTYSQLGWYLGHLSWGLYRVRYWPCSLWLDSGLVDL